MYTVVAADIELFGLHSLPRKVKHLTCLFI